MQPTALGLLQIYETPSQRSKQDDVRTRRKVPINRAYSSQSPKLFMEEAGPLVRLRGGVQLRRASKLTRIAHLFFIFSRKISLDVRPRARPLVLDSASQVAVIHVLTEGKGLGCVYWGVRAVEAVGATPGAGTVSRRTSHRSLTV